MIDLRSDTVTQPTPEMRQAMANACVGDGVIDVDPTVEQLERETASILGKESALFMPSGSMANQIGVRLHCDRGSEFLCEADCHIYQYEQGAFAQLSGLVAQPIVGREGVLEVEHVRGAIRPENDHMVRTRLLCLENTLNRWGGLVIPQETIESVCHWAHEHSLKTHLDGARIWNAAVAKGLDPSQMAASFDSVSVCFSKGLGAPVGSALAGSRGLIEQARRARKLFGGAMRQAGIIAAGALHALHHHRDRLSFDHEAARQLADATSDFSAVSVRGGRVDTNIVMLVVDPAWGSAAALQSRLYEAGVDSFAMGDEIIRFVTHMDVTAEQIDQACRILQGILGEASASH
ncbi:threonine aldolase family protein [Allorhodopirellula solitaria]|uniref:L-allo-threonine aldolase n=1 Tax=Allorhodopirellula solitaria TaxID=2527987 RepID=A0A5C5YIM1_9BACT|nr:GntG family PLP-dependent aldolase [Allorhodopirellula solitaria]TWT74725.1 L-allo-threonine aldolase [Allorhodopirellula solitaria]